MVEGAATAEGTEDIKLVCFVLDGQEYGLAIDSVKETLTMRPLTNVFLTPAWLAGIINLRGDVVAVIDLAHFLGLSPAKKDDTSRIVIARHETLVAGLLADSLTALRTISRDDLKPPPATLAPKTAALLAGIAAVEGGAALRVLSIEHLLESEEMHQFRREQ
jgi:purine-binding chemotaxis protein CheW